MDKRIKFYSQDTNLLPPKPKTSFRHLRQGTQEFMARLKAIYFSRFGLELFRLFLGPPGFKWSFSFRQIISDLQLPGNKLDMSGPHL